MALKLRRGNNQNINQQSLILPIYTKFSNLGIVKSMAKSMSQNLLEAGISEDPLLYASRVFFFLLLSAIITVVLVFFGALIFVKLYLVYRLTKYLALSLMLFIFGVIIPPVTYLALTANISQIKENRRIGIDAEMPAFSSIFLIFLRSGLSPRFVYERIAKAAAFQYINRIALYIHKRMRFLGEGVEDAMRSAASISPSRILKDYFMTYITAVKTGAPVLETMEAKSRDIMKYLELLASLSADKLSGIAEGYVIWLSSGYIMVFLSLLLEAIFPLGGGGTGVVDMLGVVTVIVIPLVNLMFVYLVEQTQLRFPEKKLNYNVFFISLIAGLLVMFILLILLHQIYNFITLRGGTNDVVPTVIAITIGLLIASVPPAIILGKIIREGTGYDPYVVGFLRAVAEGIRAGLPPEKVVKSIKDSKEMGKLGRVLREIDGYVSLGYPLKEAFRKGAERIRDFTSRISIIALSDMMEIGNLTPDTIEILAEQIDSQIRIRRDYQSKVKILLATPYVGVILALIASVILGSAILNLLIGQNYSLYGPLASAQALLPRVIYITAVSSLFNSFLAGLLVGKLATGRIADGLIHSAILVIITGIILIILLHVRFTFYQANGGGFLILPL